MADRLGYVIIRNGIATLIAFLLVELSAHFRPDMPHDLVLILGAVFAAGYIADNAIARAKRSEAGR